MGVRIIANDDIAAMYCSTSGQAFGPVFHATPEHDAEACAESFLEWLARHADTAERDPRRLSADELGAVYLAWLKGRS